MDTIKQRPDWIKEKTVDPEFEIYKAPEWNDIKDFKKDEGCYLLIKLYRDLSEIGVAICSQQHVLLKEFRGRRSQDIYNCIFKYDQENKKRWFTRFDHAAYLGKELKKAEIALALGSDYWQE